MAKGFMDPKNQFLMSMGAQLMGQPYSPVPQSTFSGIGNAFEHGMGAYQNALILQQAEQERQRLIEKERMEELAQFGKEAQQKADFGKFVASGPQSTSLADRQGLGALFNLDPGSAIGAAMELRKPQGPIIGAGELGDEHQAALLQLYGPQATEYTAQQNDAAARLVQANRVSQRAAGVQGPPSANQIFQEAQVKQSVGMMTDIMNKAPDIQALQETVGFVEQLSNAIDTGGLGEQAFTSINTGLQNFGLPTLQGTDEMAVREGLNAVQGRLINLMRAAAPADPQFSKADLEFYERQAPGLMQTPAGRKIAIDMAKAQAERAMAGVNYFRDAQLKGLGYEETISGYHNMMKNMPIRKLLDDSGKPTEAGQDLASAAAGHPPMVLNGKLLRWDESAQAYTD